MLRIFSYKKLNSFSWESLKVVCVLIRDGISICWGSSLVLGQLLAKCHTARTLREHDIVTHSPAKVAAVPSAQCYLNFRLKRIVKAFFILNFIFRIFLIQTQTSSRHSSGFTYRRGPFLRRSIVLRLSFRSTQKLAPTTQYRCHKRRKNLI